MASVNHLIYYLELFMVKRKSLTDEEIELFIEDLQETKSRTSKERRKEAIDYLITLLESEASYREFT